MSRPADAETRRSASHRASGSTHGEGVSVRRPVVRNGFRFVVGVLLLVVSCDESLPPRADPDLYLEGRMQGSYILAHQDNFLAVQIVITNTYDETLAAAASMGGRLTIQSQRDPTIVRTVELTSSHITNAYKYDPVTTELTLDPGQSLEFTYEWNLIDDRGRDLRTSFFRFIRDTTCQARCLAYTEDFVLSADIGIFAGREKISVPETTASLSYITSHINPSRCPPLDPASSRRLEPSALDQPCQPDTLSL